MNSKYSFGTDNGCMTPDCKRDNYKCPHWMESTDGGDCSLPKMTAVTECPYLKRMLLEKIKEGRR